MMKPSPIAERIERRAGNPRQQSAAKTDPPIPILSRFRFQNSLNGCSVALYTDMLK
jgi:hypothetical protein